MDLITFLDADIAAHRNIRSAYGIFGHHSGGGQIFMFFLFDILLFFEIANEQFVQDENGGNKYQKFKHEFSFCRSAARFRRVTYYEQK